MNRNGFFFSIDALIALIILLAVTFVAYPVFESSRSTTKLPGDIIKVLSTLKVGEMNSSLIQSLIAAKVINDTNSSLIEQIGALYTTNSSTAQALAQDVLKTLNTTENIGIWYDNNLTASINTTPYTTAREISVARETVSGVSLAGPSKGYVSKAWLKQISAKSTVLSIRGDLMCGKWRTYSWGDYCGPAATNITYTIPVPTNATINNAWWLAEPAWVGQPTKLYVNGIKVFDGDIQYFTIINITALVHAGNNTAILDSTTGGDDGASHIVVEYTTPDLQTFTYGNSYPFNLLNTRGVLYHEKALFIPTQVNALEIILNATHSSTAYIRKGPQTILIGTKAPAASGLINFTKSEIQTALTAGGLSPQSLTNEYFFVIVKMGSTNQQTALRKNSYVLVDATQPSPPFGSIDLTGGIPLKNATNLLQNTFYRNLTWRFHLPKNSLALLADWQLGWLSLAGNTSQRATANAVTLYNAPPEAYIPAFSRFGYSPNKAAGLFLEGTNNFSLDFGPGYGISNTSSYGILTYFIKSFVSYGDTKNKARGGTITLTFQDGTTKNIVIGDGADSWDPANDAIDDAVDRLMKQFDAEADGKIDLIVSQDSFGIDTLDISGVPYLWSTEVQVRTWR